MRLFQLDECLNSKLIEKICNEDGGYATHRFPKKYRGKGVQDPSILAEFFAVGKCIVTNDRAMLEHHVPDIPKQHPGLVILTMAPSRPPRDIDDKKSLKLLANFKARCPGWKSMPIINSVIWITDCAVQIYHRTESDLTRDLYLEYDTADFETRVSVALVRNASLYVG
ncbi:MAG: hypothetical protein ABSH20_04815 [Tepidisphaeraceae bacterium]|jgi:hypothetical protein